MIKTQVQLPDELYREAKRVAQEREISLAEVLRRGVEYITKVYPPIPPDQPAWNPPQPRSLGAFQASSADWRMLGNDAAD
jgi:hypothetical protein